MEIRGLIFLLLAALGYMEVVKMPIRGLIFILVLAMVWLFVEALFMAAEDPYDNLTEDEFAQMIEDLRRESTENTSDSRKIHGL